MSENASPRPLSGTRVLDLLTGPMAAIGRQFAELGADVIRIEPDGGAADRREGLMAAGVSLDFVAANLGKRATTPDRLSALARGADIILAGPEIDVQALGAGNPEAVTMTVSDFGRTGRFAGWRGSDAVYHALSGELSRSGIPGREPLLPPGDLAHACAAVHAAYVALLAYYQALRTGQGDHLDFSVLDGAAQALDPGYGIAGSATSGVPASQLPRERVEARFQYPIIPCKDGYVRLCVLAARQWKGMFAWMGSPAEFADPSFDRTAVRFASPTLLPAIARFFADKTKRELEAQGQSFGVPTAAVLDLDEALATEHMTARKAFAPVEIAPGLQAPFPDGVMELDGVRMGVAGPAPAVQPSLDWLGPRVVPPRASAGERPLEGLKVLDFGVIVVGAEGGRLLGDQGADVIKVENSAFPDGSRANKLGGLMSPTFAAGHRNKRGLGVNLRDAKGHEILLALVAQSDVVLTNFKGGTLKSLGLDYDTLRAVNPCVILTDSSAFGPSGPWSDRMGYGPLVRASAGLTMQWRYADDPASFTDAITVYPDHVAGRIGAIGVLALLIRRMRHDVGGTVGVSQAEVMLSHMAPQIAAKELARAGHAVTPSPTTSGVYACAGDDEWCVVTLRGEDDRRALAEVIGGEPLSAWLAARDPREAMERLQAAGVPAGVMLRVSELPDFEYFRTRGFFRQANHPRLPTPLTIEAAPVRAERLPDPPERPAPLLGEHTAEIVREALGLPEAEIRALLDAGVLEAYEPEAEDTIA